MQRVKVWFATMGESFIADVVVPDSYFTNGKLDERRLKNILETNMTATILPGDRSVTTQ